MSTDLILLAIAVVGLFALLGGLSRRSRPLDLRDPRDQLAAVRRAEFVPRPIMNKSEFRRFVWLDAWARGRRLRLFTQVSYGEVIRSADPDGHASINSKRADFVLVDSEGLPAAVIEYQGTGHYRGNAAARDAVKRAALEKAGVPFVELFPKEGREAVIAKVETALLG